VTSRALGLLAFLCFALAVAVVIAAEGDPLGVFLFGALTAAAAVAAYYAGTMQSPPINGSADAFQSTLDAVTEAVADREPTAVLVPADVDGPFADNVYRAIPDAVAQLNDHPRGLPEQDDAFPDRPVLSDEALARLVSSDNIPPTANRETYDRAARSLGFCADHGPPLDRAGWDAPVAPPCHLPAGHDGPHQAHPSWGDVTWPDAFAPTVLSDEARARLAGPDAPRMTIDDLDVLSMDRPACDSGISAFWCARCGTCTCPRPDHGWANSLDDPGCPLHGTDSDHAVEDPTHG
jgi:hypothetical protein